MRRPLMGWIACIGLLLGPMQMSNLATAAAEGSQRLVIRVLQAPKLTGERTTIRGSAEPGRLVELQRRRDGGWEAVGERNADRHGSVVFKIRVPRAATYFRLVSRQLDGVRVSQDEGSSASILVAPAKPASRLELENAPIGVDDAGREAIPGLASFWPARPGAPVVVQRRLGGKWFDVASGQQGSDGRFFFQLSPSDGATFRAISRPPQALRAIVSPTVTGEVWRESFADQFNSASLNPAWAERTSQGAGRECVTTSDAYRLRDGKLQVFAVPDTTAPIADATCPYGRYRNGHLGTQNSFSFRFGYAAARVKFSPEQGQHGGFWLQPKAEVGGLAPENSGSEIDVAEYFGDTHNGGYLGQWVHYYKSESDGKVARTKAGGLRSNVRAIVGPGAQVSDDYHVMSVEWTPQEYVFRMDGVVIWRTSAGVSHQSQYLILSMLSSDWELPRLTGDLPSPMSVDWVKVWQR